MKKKLIATQVSRGGRTARDWNRETTDVKLSEDTLTLFFSLRSKGGGITDVRVTVGPDDFPSLLAAMVSANRERTMCEIAGILKTELDRQPEQDRLTLRRGRQSVVEAAERAYQDAPDDHDLAERLTHEMVGRLVRQINASDDKATETTSAA